MILVERSCIVACPARRIYTYLSDFEQTAPQPRPDFDLQLVTAWCRRYEVWEDTLLHLLGVGTAQWLLRRVEARQLEILGLRLGERGPRTVGRSGFDLYSHSHQYTYPHEEVARGQDELLAYAFTARGIPAESRITFSPVGAGTTVTAVVALRPRGAALAVGPVLARLVGDSLRNGLVALRRTLEG